jgi:hypothetical protein
VDHIDEDYDDNDRGDSGWVHNNLYGDIDDGEDGIMI